MLTYGSRLYQSRSTRKKQLFTKQIYARCLKPRQTRSSADADKPAQRVWRSVIVPFPYVRYSFLLCNINFVFKTRRFYDIRLQKML